MKICQLLKPELIKLELTSRDKESAIRELAELMRGKKEVVDLDKFIHDVYEREQLGSTAVGDGIALPHARSEGIRELIITFGRSSQGLDFEALDEKPVNLIFLIGTPKDDVGTYLKTLAHLSRLLKKENIRNRLLSANSSQEVIEIFKEVEE
jgi:fructose-specific phosphotransferase system IIA component